MQALQDQRDADVIALAQRVSEREKRTGGEKVARIRIGARHRKAEGAHHDAGDFDGQRGKNEKRT